VDWARASVGKMERKSKVRVFIGEIVAKEEGEKQENRDSGERGGASRDERLGSEDLPRQEGGAVSEFETRQRWWGSGTAIVVWIALGTVVVHLATGWRYGFDRDELMALDDARHLAWGYVQYPPVTAFLGRLALGLFGTSLVGFRFFAAVAMAAAVALTGLMAKEMGGGKWSQVVAAIAAVPFCLGAGALMQYISFDYVCWVVVAWCVTAIASGKENRNLKMGNEKSVAGASGRAWTDGRHGSEAPPLERERWWVGVGVGIGLGMLAKYTMGFCVVGVVVGVLSTEMRRYLRSGWLWLGVLLATLIFLPNVLWEWKRGFVSLEFLRFLHARDVATGQTDWFLAGQLEITLLAFPLALAGIWFCFLSEEGKRYRILGWMYVLPLGLFLVMRGRDYYLAPAYPMLYAAGSVWVERKGRLENDSGSLASTSQFNKMVRRLIGVGLLVDVVVAGAVALPIAPVNSQWWNLAGRVDGVFREEIGWVEFVTAVAAVRDRLPASERVRVGILAGNYGEVGALNLYGERFGLPRAMSGVNSSWERGYGDPPEVVIVVGYPRAMLESEFASCVVGGRVWNRYGVMNEETIEDPEILVCRGLKGNWEEFWKKVRKFA
jgi:4-amino-4-deoxy-L-arabinose transferase-like glycosyltransferase